MNDGMPRAKGTQKKYDQLQLDPMKITLDIFRKTFPCPLQKTLGTYEFRNSVSYFYEQSLLMVHIFFSGP
jgi:hypothetical protein